MTPFGLDRKHIEDLTLDRAVRVFRDLLWANAFKLGIEPSYVTISQDQNVSDGGIDAAVKNHDKANAQHPLMAPRSRFQLKTGKTAKPWQKSWVNDELFGGKRRRRSRETLASEVLRCLDEGGRYTVVAFGHDLQDKQRTAAEKLISDAFAECGFENARVDVWGQSQIEGHLLEFPAICLNITQFAVGQFSSHAEWAADGLLGQLFEADEKIQNAIEEIRSKLRQEGTDQIRIIGEPGRGKTRLVLEATRQDDLAPLVIYTSDAGNIVTSGFFRDLRRLPADFRAILVVDDCSSKDAQSIANALAGRKKSMRLITIDHKADGSNAEVFQAPVADFNSIAAIISRYGVDPKDVERWAPLCDGSPRVAHVIGDSLMRNPRRGLDVASMEDVWERFIVGNESDDAAAISTRKRILRNCSLFDRFGYEPPVEIEGKFIAGSCSKVDGQLTYQRFQEEVAHLKKRKIIQGRTTLYITPRLLQIYLCRDFWDKHGRDFDLWAFLDGMPRPLIPWFIDMLRYTHDSQPAQAAIKRFLASERFGSRSTILGSTFEIDFLAVLAESHPEEVLECINRLVISRTEEEIRKLPQPRRYHLARALQCIAVRQEYFQAATKALFYLASIDAGGDFNVALDAIKKLFPISEGNGTTAAGPGERLAVKKWAANSSSAPIRKLAIEGCFWALKRQQLQPNDGADYQGIREPIQFWKAATHQEEVAAFQSTWDLLVHIFRSEVGEIRELAASKIVEVSWSTIHVPELADQVIDTLHEIAKDANMPIRAIVQFARRQAECKTSGLPEATRSRLRSLTEDLNRGSNDFRLRRYVQHLETFDHEHHDIAAILDELASHYVSHHNELEANLGWLVRQKHNPAWLFGRKLCQFDKNGHLLMQIVGALVLAADKAETSLLCGYLCGIFDRSSVEWESTLKDLSEIPEFRRRFGSFIRNSGFSVRAVKMLTDHCRNGEVDVSEVVDLYSWDELKRLPTNDLFALVDLLCDKQCWHGAIEISEEYFNDGRFFQRTAPPIPFKRVADLLVGFAKDDKTKSSAFGYHWSRLAKKLISQHPQRRHSFFERAIHEAAKLNFDLHEVEYGGDAMLSAYVKEEPLKCWAVIEEALKKYGAENDRLVTWMLGKRRYEPDSDVECPLDFLPLDKFFDWLETKDEVDLQFFAQRLPRSLSKTKAGKITREFIVRFAKHSRLKGILFWGFLSRGASGSADSIRRRRDEAVNWLADEESQAVIDFVEWYMRELEKELKEAEIREERRY